MAFQTKKKLFGGIRPRHKFTRTKNGSARTSNIQDAEIIETTKTNNQSIDLNGNSKLFTDDSGDIFNENENKNHEKRSDESFEEHKTGETTINVEKKVKQKSVPLNLMDEGYIDEFIAQDTEDAMKDDPDEGKGGSDTFKGKTADEIREKLSSEEGAKKMSAEEFEMVAKFLINVIDTGISTGLRAFAKDTTDTGYSITTPKKNMLIEQLTFILIKHQTKFSMEFMFIIAILVCYSVPAKNAFDRRKELKEEMKKQNDEAIARGETPTATLNSVAKLKVKTKGRPKMS